MSLRPHFDGLDPAGHAGGRVWLNCAHQGPLPAAAASAVRQALDRKRSPWLMANADFEEVPRRLRAALGRLVGAPPDEVILGNSTSYGLNLLVQGLPLRAGDEVLLVDGDFPATVYPWLPLRRRGVAVRMIRAPFTADEFAAALTPATRVFCSSWVFSFTGWTMPREQVAEVCRSHGVAFVLNGSQAVGARPIDVATAGVDALVSCGFKWLCGPYATGFAWISPALRDTMTLEQAYWLTHQSAAGTGRSADYELRPVGAAGYDVFCTANFLAFPAWTESVELLLSYGIGPIAGYDQSLVQRLVDQLDESRYELLSPRAEPERSTLVVLRSRAEPNEAVYERLRHAGVEVAMREGNLRVSPHVYNEPADIDRLLVTLAEPPGGR